MFGLRYSSIRAFAIRFLLVVTKQHMRGRLKPAPDPVKNKRTPSPRRAANVEVRWKKWCVSKNEQSCRQGNRLCKSSPYFLCDYGEKEAKKQNAVPAGGLSQVQPRATAQSPPGRAAHPPMERAP